MRQGRPSALTPNQQDQIRARLAAGEGVRPLAAEYGVGKATIGRLSGHTGRVREVAQKIAHAQSELATLPISSQHQAVSLAEKLREASQNIASAACYGAATAHRLSAIANAQAQKLDDAEPFGDGDVLRNIHGLTKMANDASVVAMGLLSSNKDAAAAAQKEQPPAPSFDPKKISSGALQELLDARVAAK